MQLAERIRAMAAPHWAAVFALILGGWAIVYAMALPADLREAARFYGPDFWESLCVVTPDAAGYGRLVLMWGAMSAAMMLPTMLPALATYDELPTTDARGAGGLIGGYMAVWLGFSVLAAAAQLGLWQAGLLDALGVSTERWLTALLLAGAGAYQFTAFKAACLSRCRQPLTFFMQHWAPGTRNAAAMGLRLGALCLGCCWALMALGFVGGTMNLVWMGVATVLMVIEKLPLTGRYLTAPLGVALLAAAPFAAAGLL